MNNKITKSIVVDAKNILNKQINLLKSIKEHVCCNDPVIKKNALLTTFVLDQYIKNNLVNDVNRLFLEQEDIKNGD